MASDVSLASSSPGYLSGGIKWSGLASGVDFASVVESLIEIERINVTRLSLWRSEWVEKTTSISGLNTRMKSLELHARDLDTFSEFNSRNTSSSNSSVATAVNTASAETGSHTVEVGQYIPGQVISKSFDSTAQVGGADDLVITVGTASLTLTASGPGPPPGEYDPTGTLDDLAAAILAADDPANGGPDILADVYTMDDKDRDGTMYKRLVIAANAGGSANEITVSGGPSDNLCLNQTAVDDVVYTSWIGSSTTSVTAGGVYYGATNKTFTFAVDNTGVLGTDDITINWADTEGNSGSFTIEAEAWNADPGQEFDVFQGVTVSFSDIGGGNMLKNEAFTIDVHSPVFQAAQDSGLAQAEKLVHSGFVDLITPISENPAEFTYRYEGVETTVQVGNNATLQDLVDAINNDSDNPGVEASIIDDGLGTSTSYHLILTGKETGAEHTIRLVSHTFDNFNADPDQFTMTQKAEDSMFKVDGFPSDPDSYIQRSNNTITDVVNGLILELNGVGQATITVADDAAQVKEKIEQFIQSINFVLDYIKQETKYDPDSGEKGIMLGNYSFDIVRNTINQIMAEPATGLDSETDKYTLLSQIGIKTDPDQGGIWVVDSSKLQDALDEDLEAVARLFVQDPDHDNVVSQGVAFKLKERLSALTDGENGIANVLLKNYSGIISQIDQKITQEERRIAQVRDRLEQKFARLEMVMSEMEGQSQYLESQLEKLPKLGG